MALGHPCSPGMFLICNGHYICVHLCDVHSYSLFICQLLNCCCHGFGVTLYLIAIVKTWESTLIFPLIKSCLCCNPPREWLRVYLATGCFHCQNWAQTSQVSGCSLWMPYASIWLDELLHSRCGGIWSPWPLCFNRRSSILRSWWDF